jgi:quercetin dioxygenase-like cupin family protein
MRRMAAFPVAWSNSLGMLDDNSAIMECIFQLEQSARWLRKKDVRRKKTISIAVIALFAALAIHAQQAQPKRTDLLNSDLAGIAGKRVTVYRLEINPGTVAGRHRHPLDTFVYVLEGTLTLEQEGQATRTLDAGEVVHEVPGGIYNARNTGTRPVTLLVVSLGEKDQPFSVPVK